MVLSQSVDAIIGEMISLKQILRKTAPVHKLDEEEAERFRESIARTRELLKALEEEVGACSV